MRVARVIVALVAVSLFAACGSTEQQPAVMRYRVTFTAHADGEPLGGVYVLVAGRPIGQTGPNGVLPAVLPGREGLTLPVAAQCPQGHKLKKQPPNLTLRTFRGLDPAAAARGITLSIACPPTRRLAAVVVRAPGRGGLPVTIRGREVGRTDASGAAHLLFRLPPTTTFRVELDTSAHPDLKPKNPGATFTVPDSDQIFLYDQRFKVKRHRPPPLPPPPPPPRIPTRLR